MANISIIARSGGTTSTVSGESASVVSPSIVKLKINPQDIAELDRSGNDLVITLKDGEKITVENFYAVDAQGNGNELVLEDPNGALWWVKDPQTGLHFAPLTDIDDLMLAQAGNHSALGWGLGILGAVGIGVAAAAGGGGGGHNNNDDPPTTGGKPDPEPTLLDNVANLVITDNVAQTTGSIARGGSTNDSTPTLSGTAIPNSIVTIYDGTTKLGSVQADAKGAWSFTPANLSDGVHSFSTTVTVGNLTSSNSGGFVVTIDTHAPDAVTLLIATDNQKPGLGTLVNGQSTNDNTPVLSGKAEPGSTVNIYDGNTLVGSAVADAQGNWGLELSTPLKDGVHSLTANATDLAGNVGPTTTVLNFTVDTDAPKAMTTFDISDNVGGYQGPLHSTDVTDDSTPTFSGAANSVEGGATVSIYDGTTLLGSVKAAADGSWSFTPGAPLDPGSHTFTTEVTDAAGNVSDKSPDFELIILPPTGLVTGLTVSDDVSPVTGPLANGAITNDNTPTFTGKASPISVVTVFDNGVQISGSILVDPLSGWSFTPPSGLADGTHVFTFAVNGSMDPQSFVLVIDTKVPDPVGDITVVDDLNPDIGQLHSGDSTNDGTPIISGMAEAGTTVTIYNNGIAIGTALVGSDGHWGFTPGTALTEGSHTITTTVTDLAGNISAPSADFVLVVDTEAPQPVALFIATDNSNPVVGTIVSGDVTNDSTPVLSGQAEPGSEIIIYDNGVELARAVADAKGNWGLELSTPLSDGSHSLTVVAVDAAGNVSQPTPELVFSVDTATPLGAINIVVTDDVGPVQGKLTSGSTTDDTTPTFSGRAEPNGTVSVYDGTTLLGQATADSTGRWSFTPSAPLPSGLHHFTTTVTDAAGNASPASPTFDLTISPIAGPISGLVVNDNVNPIIGALTNGAATNDDTPTFSGKATANSTLRVYDNGVLVATIPVDASGNWTYTPSPALGNGSHSVTFTVDSGSGPSVPSEPFVVTVDTAAPNAVTGLTVVDDKSPGIGQLVNGGITNDNTPIISGRAEPGTTVTIYDGGVVIGTAKVDDDGQWGFTPGTPLTDGTHHITTTVTDAAGNVSAASPDFVLGVDVTAPNPPTQFIVTDNVQANVGTVDSGAATNDSTPILSGKGEAGAEIIIYDGETEIGRTTVDALGNWGLELATPLTDGAHSLTAVAVDAAGNASQPTAAIDITVDTLAPNRVTDLVVTEDNGVLNNGQLTTDATLIFSGTAEKGTTVSVYDNGVLLGTAPVGNNGTWTFTPDAPLTTGAHTFTTQVTDSAGNTSLASDPFITSVSPPLDSVTGVMAIDNVLPVSGLVTSGGTSNDNHLTFTGNAPIGSTVTVYDNGVPVMTVQVSVLGTWIWSSVPALTEGLHNFTFTSTVGTSISAPSAPFVVTIDTHAPDPVANLTVVDDADPSIGQVANGGSTNDGTPIISGTAEPGTTVTLYDDNIYIGQVTVGADGHWGFIPSTPLVEGNHYITTQVTDAAGNTSGLSPVFVLEVDTGAPSEATNIQVYDDRAPSVGYIVSGDATNDNTPTLSGRSEANAVITIYDGNNVIGTTQANGLGIWSFTPTAVLSDGPHSLTTTVTDGAGNTSSKSPPFTLTVDTTPPAVITAMTITADTGVLAPGGSTKDTTLTVSGNSEPNSIVNIYDSDGKTLLGTVTAGPSGSWSVAIASLGEGSHSITATATDALGNTSVASPPAVVVIDLSAPAQMGAITVTDNKQPSTGVIHADDRINDNLPTLSGRAEAYSTVNIYDGLTLVATTQTDANGNWSVTPTAPLGDKSYTLTATATDAAGNTSVASPGFSFTVDTQAPNAMSGLTVAADGTPLLGGASTNDTTPSISGVSEVGATIIVYDTDGKTVLGTTVAGVGGAWTVNLPVLSEGSHTLTATSTDAAGNASVASSPVVVVIDTTPPAQISGITVSDTKLPTTGPVVGGTDINDNLPTLSGRAEANSIIKVYNGSTLIGTGQANADGDWSFAPTVALPDGNYSLTATATDSVGNVSKPSPSFSFTVDTQAPDPITALIVTDNVAPVIGNVANGGSTNDTTPTFSGKVEAGATVTLYNGAAVMATVKADSNGNWSYTSAALDQGTYHFTAKVTDSAGNASTASTDFVLTIDTAAPLTAPTFTVSDDVSPIISPVLTGGSTNDPTPTLNGFAELGSTVTIYNGTTILGTAQASAIDGSWTFTPGSNLLDGEYNLKATATDAAGNVGPASPIFDLIIDTVAPANVTNLAVSDNVSPVTGLLTSGSSTNDTTPTFTGRAEAGSTVTFYNNGNVLLGAVTADSNGQWTFTPTLSIDDVYKITTTVTDKAGNVSIGTSPIFELTIDTVKPNPVGSFVVTDDVLPVSGSVGNGKATNDTTPTLSGTAEPNSSVILFDNGVWVATVKTDGGGAWQYLPTGNLSQGQHSFTTIVEDAAGNQSVTSPPFVITVDSVAPNAVTGLLVNDTVSPVSGLLTSGNSTNDMRPTFSGSAEAGTTVALYEGTTKLGEVQVDVNGHWSLSPTDPLDPGLHNISVVVTDAAGNVSTSNPTFTLTVDTVAPDPVSTITASDNAAPQVGTITNGFTNDTTPTFSGTAEKGSTVTVYDGVKVLGTVTASATDGSWSFTPTTPLGEGAHTITATATDAAGNEGLASPTLNLTVDTIAPAVANFVVNDNEPGGKTGNLVSGDVSNDRTPTLNGTADNGGTVTIYNGTDLLGTVPVSDTGVWTFTPGSLSDGTYNFITVVTDKAGNVSGPSASFTVIVDGTAPVKPGSITATDDVANYQGTVPAGGLTNDPTPTLSGVVEANALVTIYQDGVFIGTTNADAAGRWSYTTAPLTDETYGFYVTATDKAGNVSDRSDTLSLEIDTKAPTGISILLVSDLSGAIVDSNQPTFTSLALTGELDVTINIYDNGKLLGSTTVDGAGVWQFTPNVPLADGPHNFTVTVMDKAGNESPPSAAVQVTVDTSGPNGGITDLAVYDDVQPLVGNITSGGVTNDQRPDFSGKAPAGAEITFYDNGQEIGRTTVNGDGTWSFTPSSLLDGSHLITTTVTDGGITSPPKALIQFTVDTSAPSNLGTLVVTDDQAPGLGNLTSGDTTNDKTPTFSGGIVGTEIGSTVIITDGGLEIGRATIGLTGLWSITPTIPLGEGLHNFVITVVDQAGNSSGTNFTLTIDSLPPAQITTFTLVDDVAPGLSNIAQNGFTNDTKPTLVGAAGSAEGGSTISVYDGIFLLGTTVANPDGSWSFETPTLLNGSHSLTVTATDSVGNVSIASPAANFTVDTLAPTPILALTVSNNVGSPALASGVVSNDNTPIISGRAEAGSLVTVYNGAAVVGTVTAAADGTWSLAPSSMGDGTYVLTATATDAAGNVSTPSPSFSLTIDTAAPNAPLAFTVTDNILPNTGSIANNGATNDTRPVLTGAAGSVEANALVTVYDGGTLLGTARAQADGSWSFTPLLPLGNSSHALSVTATDAAGNVSGSSPIFNVTVDTIAPVQPGAITFNDNVGSIVGNLTNGAATDDTQPLLSGTVEGGAKVNIYDNGVLLTTVTANGAGLWTFQVTTPLATGSHSFSVTATDAAGNVSLPSASFNVTVDTTAPAPISSYTVTDDVSPVTGTLTSGSATNDNRPTISGLGATPNSTVIIMDGAVEIGRADVNALGIWSFTPVTPLVDGPHSITLRVTDEAGNTSTATPAFNLTVDTSTPTVGLLPIVSDNFGAVVGDLANGARSDDNTPTLRGTVEGSAWVNIYDGSTLLATVQANASGAWTYTPSALSDGVHRFSTTVSDSAGNVSASSPVFTLTIDTTPPAAASNITVSDNVNPVSGLVANGGFTNDNTPTLNGTAEANSTVTIYNGNTVLGTALADGNGAWTFTPSALTDGTYTLSTTVTDQVGNVGARSPNFVITVDTQAPATLGALTVTDDVQPNIGTVNNNGSSNDTRPTIGGVSEVGATITIYDGAKVLGTTTAGVGGVWSFTPTVALADGAHTFTAVASDAAGNIGGTSPTFTLNIDTAAPAVITGLTVTDDVAPDLGNLTTGSITNDTRPTFAGVAEANSQVNIYDGGVVVATVTAGANGQWTWTPTTALTSTTHNFTFSATDAAGNEGPKTPVFTVTIDPTIGTQILNAVNDEVGLSLTTSVQQISGATGATQNLNVLNLGVGDLLTVNLIQTNQLPTFHVDEGASRALSLKASATGVTLLSTFDLYIYKANGDGTYSMYQKVDNLLKILLLTGSSGTVNLNLPSGDYALMLKADDGLSLLTGSQLQIISDVTTGVFVDTAGGTTTGNVITGAGGGGIDSAPNGTVVSGVSIGASSSMTTVNATGNTVINGTYGTLTINAQGGYTYALKAGVSPSSITGPEVFTYQLKAPNGSTSNATLTIDLSLPNLHASSDVVTLEVDPTPMDVNTAGISTTSLVLASVTLGTVLAANISTAGQLQIDVPEGGTRTFTLGGSVVGVALGATYDLYIYKYNPTTGQYEQSQFLDNWIKAPLLAGSNSQSFTLGSGHYVFLLKADGLLSVATFATITTSNDVTHTQQAAVESVTGNVITGAGNTSGGVDVAPAGTVVSNVNGQAVAATGNTVINGNYGTLTINAQGVYTYTLKTGQPATSLGQETFTYVIRNGSSVSTATLTISLPSVGQSAAPQSMLSTMALVSDESVVQDSTSTQTTAQAATLLASTSETTAEGTTLQVASADALENSALVLTFSTLPTANGQAVYQILDAQGHLIATGTLTADLTTLTANIALGNTVLHDGQYSILLQDTAGNALSSEFGTVLTSVAVTPEAAAAGVTVEGQITEIAQGTLWASITFVNGSGQQVTETAGSGVSQTLQGLYGTLVLHADGSYSYTLRDGVSMADLTQREQFEYTLKAADGTLSHGNLTIDLHPHVDGSDKSDITTSSAYDDTYTLGSGGDTVVFNLLDDKDASGGNGHNNHWTDFSVSDGDHIDISKLLTDWSGKSEDLGQYLSIEHTASGDTVVSIDRDGAGTQYQSTQLITLDGVQPTLEELLHQDPSAHHG
ncbi:BapA/Bap/LapF family large adhesin [Kluyvera sp. STS39-E]|uniref:BapA/Bap/LapF family large adhesin n=1 Tax=Kluyvera sp. STS39-E TaxID=3234748 RepID=UPI0034C68833